MTIIRRAAPDDIPAIAATLGAAFAHYPWTRWALPEDDYLGRIISMYTLDLTYIGFALDEVWMTDDATAVAIWIPPKDTWTAEIDWDRHERETMPLLGDLLSRTDLAQELLNAHRPKDPSWYLVTAGVHPDYQRKGLGSAVLRPVLDRCDAEGMPCLTETSSPGNLRFYERLGFKIVTEIIMPENGPPVWILWRKPR